MAPERFKGEIKMVRIQTLRRERREEKTKKEANSSKKNMVGLQRRKWEMSLQEEPRMHTVSVCLAINS